MALKLGPALKRGSHCPCQNATGNDGKNRRMFNKNQKNGYDQSRT